MFGIEDVESKFLCMLGAKVAWTSRTKATGVFDKLMCPASSQFIIREGLFGNDEHCPC